jgi:hypothetical protein
MKRIIRVIGAMVVVAECLAGVSYAAVTAERLCIRIYDIAGVNAKDRGRAVKRAGEIIRGTDVPVDWRDCSPEVFGADPACATPPGAGEFVVRLVSGAVGDARVLGEAFVDTAKGTGVLATVFVDRVYAFAAAAKTDVLSVLGRVIAHEIGHLMLGSNDHTETGLMRATWSHETTSRDRGEDWQFSRSDLARIRQLRQRTS